MLKGNKEDCAHVKIGLKQVALLPLPPPPPPPLLLLLLLLLLLRVVTLSPPDSRAAFRCFC
jgi:hypothetical protein